MAPYCKTVDYTSVSRQLTISMCTWRRSTCRTAQHAQSTTQTTPTQSRAVPRGTHSTISTAEVWDAFMRYDQRQRRLVLACTLTTVFNAASRWRRVTAEHCIGDRSAANSATAERPARLSRLRSGSRCTTFQRRRAVAGLCGGPTTVETARHATTPRNNRVIATSLVTAAQFTHTVCSAVQQGGFLFQHCTTTRATSRKGVTPHSTAKQNHRQLSASWQWHPPTPARYRWCPALTRSSQTSTDKTKLNDRVTNVIRATVCSW